MVMVPLTLRMGLEPILPVKGTVIADTVLNFDGDLHGQGHVDVVKPDLK